MFSGTSHKQSPASQVSNPAKHFKILGQTMATRPNFFCIGTTSSTWRLKTGISTVMQLCKNRCAPTQLKQVFHPSSTPILCHCLRKTRSLKHVVNQWDTNEQWVCLIHDPTDWLQCGAARNVVQSLCLFLISGPKNTQRGTVPLDPFLDPVDSYDMA